MLKQPLVIGLELLCLTLLSHSTRAIGEPTSVEKQAVATMRPDKPRWGDTLIITYNQEAESAQLKGKEQIYLVYFLYFPDTSDQKWVAMKKEDNAFKATVSVPKGASGFQLYFITKEKWDRDATQSVMIYDEEGKPVRGAYLVNMDWKKELELYPDNYRAYKFKWMMLSYEKGEKEAIGEVKNDLSKLEQIKQITPELLLALSYGYILTGDEDRSRSYLRTLYDKFASHPMLLEAIIMYEGQTYVQGTKGEGPEEVKQMKIDIIRRYPTGEIAREGFTLESLAWDSTVSIDIIENAANLWIKDQPDNPWPYYVLAAAYQKRDMHLDKAEELISKALELTLEGKLRLYEDVSGSLTKLKLPQFYEMRARIRIAKGNLHDALGDINSALDIAPETYHKGNLYILRGAVCEQLGYKEKAENDYLLAHLEGEEEAKNKLLSLYKSTHNTEEGFEDYLKLKEKELRKEKKEEYKEATDFEFTDMEGNKGKISELKGKVVVINFWAIGCKPCVAEIPELNELVKEFKDKDVIFLAIASDKKKRLERFLKTHPFYYRVVPEAWQIFKLYKVAAIPVHIVIDQQGYIRFKRLGGGPKVVDQLRKTIVQLTG